MVQQYSGPVAAIALRDGGTLAIFNDRVEAPGQAFGIAQLTYAGLTSDPLAPAGQAGVPALRVAVRNGIAMAYIPADPPDAQRALDAIYGVRPDLRTARWPGAALAAGDVVLPGDQQERIVAMFAHLSVFLAPILLPLIFWVATRQSMPYASRQARQAFWFNLGTIVVLAIDAGLVFLVVVGSALWAGASGSSGPVGAGFVVLAIGGLAAVALVITSIVYSIIGAIQAARGLPFHYPFMRRV